MIPDGVVSILQVAHVLANSALFFALAYQGLLGWRIRNRRVKGALQDFGVVKRHRTLGPILATLLPIGYLAGLSTTYIGRALWVRYPGHFAVGTALLVVMGSAALVSKKIRGPLSPWRAPHFALGLLLLCGFLAQIFLGLNIFL